KGMLIAVDADIEAVEKFVEETNKKNVIAIQGNFANLKELITGLGIESVDVVLFDFGLSSDQLDNPDRGFSFQKSGPLDMRLDREKTKLTAANILNSFSEKDLERVIREYGEEKNSKRLARAIVKIR